MKCDACGHESGFEAAFIKQPRSFGRSPRQVCASCWVHRNNRRHLRFRRIKRFFPILAGPDVNALMAVGVIVLWQGSPANYDFDALPKGPRLFLVANFFVVLVNPWPFQTKTGFALPTDGKQLLQLISFRKKALDEVKAFQFAIDAMLKRDEGNLSGAQEACEKG